MSKRDLAFLTATTDNNLEPRSKRRRDTKSEEQDVAMADAISTAAEDEGEAINPGPTQSKEEVKEQGLKLWYLVKDAEQRVRKGNLPSPTMSILLIQPTAVVKQSLMSSYAYPPNASIQTTMSS